MAGPFKNPPFKRSEGYVRQWVLAASAHDLTPRFIFEFDPKEFVEALSATAEDVHTAADKVLFDVAQEVRSYVRKGILSGRFELAPLSASWAAFKARKKLDPRVLVASRRYVESIEVVQLFGGGGYMVRPAPNKIHPGYPGKPGGRYTMEELGRKFEYGYAYILPNGTIVRVPPRPHWRPTADHFRAELPRVRNAIQARAQIEMEARLRAAKDAMRKKARQRSRRP